MSTSAQKRPGNLGLPTPRLQAGKTSSIDQRIKRVGTASIPWRFVINFIQLLQGSDIGYYTVSDNEMKHWNPDNLVFRAIRMRYGCPAS